MSRDLLRTIAPELESETDARLDTFLEMAASQMSPGAWGALYEQGATYLAAHLLTVSARGQGGAGVITSQKTGDVSVTYAGPSQGGGGTGYESTNYGQQYLALRRQLAAGSPSIAGG